MLRGLALCVALLSACKTAGADPEVERLRAEVDALRRDVDALKASADPARPTGAEALTGAAPAEVTGEVTVTIAVTPADAAVYVDDQRITERTLKRPASDQTLRIRVEKTGFRVVQQSVSLSRSHDLVYDLPRGRGMERRPTAR